ncbi:MAG: hypothetical protein LBB05_04350 [Puniceicoccales bacterium]|jgi:hypothetical protein|nr:hypothetical protein [Puniceicoccales bacterium]
MDTKKMIILGLLGAIGTIGAYNGCNASGKTGSARSKTGSAEARARNAALRQIENLKENRRQVEAGRLISQFETDLENFLRKAQDSIGNARTCEELNQIMKDVFGTIGSEYMQLGKRVRECEVFTREEITGTLEHLRQMFTEEHRNLEEGIKERQATLEKLEQKRSFLSKKAEILTEFLGRHKLAIGGVIGSAVLCHFIGLPLYYGGVYGRANGITLFMKNISNALNWLNCVKGGFLNLGGHLKASALVFGTWFTQAIASGKSLFNAAQEATQATP